MRHFAFRPSLTVRGRKFRGARGWAGKPAHPPLTDVPITAYMFAGAFDLLSAILHSGHPQVSRELFHAGTWTITAGAAMSVLAAFTGWVDWRKSSEPGTQARRTVNAHAITMITVTVLVLIDVAWRLAKLDAASTPAGVVALSVIAALGVAVGATIGGTLVFDYGFNVETAGDHPVWHHSEADLLPGQKPAAP
jgi:uncharacterized membrane protein